MAGAMTDVKSIFARALELASPADREAFLAQACGDDPRLRAEVESLLRADQAASGFLNDLCPPQGPTIDQPVSERPGDVIGSYKLLEQIGEGGFGVVFLTEQTEPVRRKVALKVLKPGMDTRQVVARFEAERQALAIMDHPNIARVFDGGATSTGRPYFVMELVRGVPITDYCDQNHLPPRQRLELFVQVCQAVQHAHQKGIIHRDLKPSNVLVSRHDSTPVVKVIDFGVAKALGRALTDKTLFTGVAQMVGTPLYMSPEQAGMSDLDVDTRADIYSLGVLLYELLTGTTPFTRDRFRKAAYDEIRRIIREEEPPKPSTRLSESKDSLPSISAQRQTEPAKLTKLLQGELDWIVMKALEKDRNRRYETANGFAMDVQRYLSDDPVQACPPSARYRLKKLVRRNRPQVIAAGLVLVVLVAGLVGTTLGLLEATRQSDKAMVAANEEKTAKQEAERNLAFATRGNEILGSVFSGLDPKVNYATLGEFTDVLRANLKQAVKELDGSSVGDPLVVAQMQNTLGLSLLGLGDSVSAVELLEKARATRADRLGPDHPLTLTSTNDLAGGYQAARRPERALPLLQGTLELRKARLGLDHPDTLTSMNNLAGGYHATGQLDKALPLLEETARRSTAALGRDHADTLIRTNNLALGYRDNGQVKKALPLFEETLTGMKARLGRDDPNTLQGMNNLAAGYLDDGQLDKAVPLFEETVRLSKAKLGPDHPDTLVRMGNLAMSYRRAGLLDKALPLFEETLTRMRVAFGRDDPNTLQRMHDLAMGYRDAGQMEKAVPLFEETFELRKARLGPDHPDTLRCQGNLGKTYCMADRGEKAASTLLDFVAGMRKRSPKGDPGFAGVLTQVSLDLLGCGQFAAAEAMLREALTIRGNARPDDWITFDTQSMLGGALLGQRKYAAAEPVLLDGYHGMRLREMKIPPQDQRRFTEALDRLIQLYTETNKPDEVGKWKGEKERWTRSGIKQ